MVNLGIKGVTAFLNKGDLSLKKCDIVSVVVKTVNDGNLILGESLILLNYNCSVKTFEILRIFDFQLAICILWHFQYIYTHLLAFPYHDKTPNNSYPSLCCRSVRRRNNKSTVRQDSYHILQFVPRTPSKCYGEETCC